MKYRIKEACAANRMEPSADKVGYAPLNMAESNTNTTPTNWAEEDLTAVEAKKPIAEPQNCTGRVMYR